MANAIDIDTLIYSQIWLFLEGDDPWSAVFAVENRIKYDIITGTQTPGKQNTADGDYPQVELLPPLSGNDQMFTADETFGTYASDTALPPQWLERGNRVFRLIQKSQLLSQQEWSGNMALARNALRKGGPRLGLAFVTSLIIQWNTAVVDRQDDNENDGMRRIKNTIDIRIGYEADGRSLLGD